jgi:hypothetical protein
MIALLLIALAVWIPSFATWYWANVISPSPTDVTE